MFSGILGKIFGFIIQKVVSVIISKIIDYITDALKEAKHKKTSAEIREAQELSEKPGLKDRMEGNQKSEDVFNNFT